MNASAGPTALHVALQYICRVHGLTPHASTGRCPFELIKEGPVASLFPHLTRSLQRKSELTAVQQTARRSGRRVVFAQGDTVNVFDFKTKRTSLGIVKSVLSNNTYSVDCGFGPKHVSGDALSKSTLTYQEGSQQELTAQDNHDQYPLQEDHTGQRESDVVVESDSSDDEDDFYQRRMLPAPAAAAAPRRRRVRDLGLGPLMPTRLRQRR